MVLKDSTIALVMEATTTIVGVIDVIFEHLMQLPSSSNIEIKFVCPNTLTLFQD
jgi:hypothetical protein